MSLQQNSTDVEANLPQANSRDIVHAQFAEEVVISFPRVYVARQAVLKPFINTERPDKKSIKPLGKTLLKLGV